MTTQRVDPHADRDAFVVGFDALSPMPDVDELLATAAHEMRAPAHSLCLTVDAMMRFAAATSVELPAPLVALLRNAHRQSHHLARLSKVLFDVSRLEPSAAEVERVDLSELAADVVMRLALEGTTGRIQVLASEPVVGLWSLPLVDQIITNLVSNALKYGENRPVTISVACEGTHAVLKVHDQGIGIAADRLPHVFDPFERAVTSKRFEGLGLGLFVVRRLVVALGGQVGVTSELGVGSTFVVRLPRGATS